MQKKAEELQEKLFSWIPAGPHTFLQTDEDPRLQEPTTELQHKPTPNNNTTEKETLQDTIHNKHKRKKKRKRKGILEVHNDADDTTSSSYTYTSTTSTSMSTNSSNDRKNKLNVMNKENNILYTNTNTMDNIAHTRVSIPEDNNNNTFNINNNKRSNNNIIQESIHANKDKSTTHNNNEGEKEN